jgi:hypothetical protein
MAAPNVLSRWVAWRQAHGMSPNIVPHAVVDANQTIRGGDLVKLVAGKVQQAIALPGADATATLSGGSTVPSIYGIADASITTDATGYDTSGGISRGTIPVVVFDDNIHINLRLYAAASGNAELQDLTKGTAYQFARYRVTSTNWFYVVTTTTTNGEFVYIEAPDNLIATNTYPNVWLRSVAAVRQG